MTALEKEMLAALRAVLESGPLNESTILHDKTRSTVHNAVAKAEDR